MILSWNLEEDIIDPLENQEKNTQTPDLLVTTRIGDKPRSEESSTLTKALLVEERKTPLTTLEQTPSRSNLCIPLLPRRTGVGTTKTVGYNWKGKGVARYCAPKICTKLVSCPPTGSGDTSERGSKRRRRDEVNESQRVKQRNCV